MVLNLTFNHNLSTDARFLIKFLVKLFFNLLKRNAFNA